MAESLINESPGFIYGKHAPEERVKIYRKIAKKNPELRASLVPRLNKYILQIPTEKQTAFLLLNHFREGFFGGAGGGGKSTALLQGALQYVDVPGYAALILRRTYKDLSLPNSILDRANVWLRGTDARWSPKHYRWHFPTTGADATLTFGYLQHDNDAYQYDSAEFQYVAFDELTQFSSFQYRFLFARTRRLKAYPVPIRTRSASNPGGAGHAFVKSRFIIEKKPSRFYLPATMEDNPYLDVVDYRKSLAELDPVMRAQRELGDWDVDYGGAMFKRSWFGSPISAAPVKLSTVVRYWDFAGTLDGGDWTVGTKVGRGEDKLFYVPDVVRGQWSPGQVESIVMQTAVMDGRSTIIRIEQEPGSSGKAVTERYIKLLAGYDVKGIPATGSKVTRWRPFAAQCEANNVKIISAPWNNEWIDEICAVPESKHDDQADSVAGAFNTITSEPEWEFSISRINTGRH